MDIADIRVANVAPEGTHRSRITYTGSRYRAKETGLRNNFPPNTRGFLYLHRPDRSCITSGIRFRVVDKPDPTLFDQGKDLLRLDGAVWSIPLVTVIKGRTYSPFRELILRDNLISQSELAVLESSDMGMKPGMILLSSMTQPFECDFAPTSFAVRVQEEDKFHRFRVYRPQAIHGITVPFLAQFELVYRQDPLMPFVVLRLLKFTAPPKSEGPLKPDEGELVKCLPSPIGNPYIWTIHRSTLPPPCLEALKRAYPPHPSRLYGRPGNKGPRVSLEPVASELFQTEAGVD
ncbi:hypothetical protein CC2G_004791 [Coprinopsis cinerea AmutBmut pab1-1]|nr:hypothetical protein CC2G_004791 [Coprinopsis cinerea AmutBmut pab1-1]